MLNRREIPWVEKCPWLTSVVTHYSLNVLTRPTEKKEPLFWKCYLQSTRAGWLVCVGNNSSKGLCDFVEGIVSLPNLSNPILGTCFLWWNPLFQSSNLELTGVGDSFRWAIRIFFLKRGVKSWPPLMSHNTMLYSHSLALHSRPREWSKVLPSWDSWEETK